MNTLPTLSESLKHYRTHHSASAKAGVRIAILSSFTLKGLKECLYTQLHLNGIDSEIYMAGYNQYAQEILNPTSVLYSKKPDIVFLCIDTRSLLGEDFFHPYTKSTQARKKFVQRKLQELQSFIETISNRIQAKIVVHNFSLPSHSPLGILENKQEFGFREAIESLNTKLRTSYKKSSNVFVFDFSAFCTEIGIKHIVDESMYYIGDIHINFDSIPKLAYAYTGYIKPLTARTKKCIVLDLDNTLWGGVIGEDGLSGIKLGPTPEGRPFWEFQKHLLSLFHRGVILAINSKNNEADALEVLRKHPHMVLKEKHFASIRINWEDKATNLQAIAKEINIGLDSLVFFDDDELNRELVRTKHPEVLVVDVPKNAAKYSSTLMELNDFNTLQLTKEDLRKGELYAQQRERLVLEKNVTNLDDFLKSLQMKIVIEPASALTVPRISQLSLKTNQFNLTTKRYQQEDIEKFIQDNHLVTSISVTDKFGDNGLTGVCIVRKQKNEWWIDTFLLSCRIIGRKVEETILWHIISQAKANGVQRVIGEYIPTKKNDLVKNFYEKNGFHLQEEKNEGSVWVFETSVNFPKPTLVSVINKIS